MLSKTKIFVTCQIRWCSTVTRPRLTESVNNLIDNNELKHRQHPGIIKKNVISLPTPIFDAINTILEDYPNRKQIIGESVGFSNHLYGRHVPLEEKEQKLLHDNAHDKLLKKRHLQNLSVDELHKIKRKNEGKVSVIVKQKVNYWQETVYDTQKSLLYMVVRSVPNYAVLHSIFNEIRIRDETFKPKNVLDFGSGIGSTIWAINELWPKEVKGFVNVDISNEINSLSERIVNILYPKFEGILYRQFMPMSLRPNYDITVSAYSLIELPNTKTRLDAVMKLWKKTKNYLVIVEDGTSAGFQIVSEARDFILHLSQLSDKDNKPEETHVFSPCPHDLDCPKPNSCYFVAGYNSIPFLGKTVRHQRYSYVVFKKGGKLDNSDWPRLISSPLRRGGHVICRMCNSSGNLEETIFTRNKHGKNLYRCAKLCKWGDRIPLEMNVKSDENVNIESDCKNNENTTEMIENEDCKDETIK